MSSSSSSPPPPPVGTAYWITYVDGCLYHAASRDSPLPVPHVLDPPDLRTTGDGPGNPYNGPFNLKARSRARSPSLLNQAHGVFLGLYAPPDEADPNDWCAVYASLAKQAKRNPYTGRAPRRRVVLAVKRWNYYLQPKPHGRRAGFVSLRDVQTVGKLRNVAIAARAGPGPDGQEVEVDLDHVREYMAERTKAYREGDAWEHFEHRNALRRSEGLARFEVEDFGV